MPCMKRENLPLLQSVVTASNPRRTMSHTQRRQVSVLWHLQSAEDCDAHMGPEKGTVEASDTKDSPLM